MLLIILAVDSTYISY